MKDMEIIAKTKPKETLEEHTGHLIEGFKVIDDLYGSMFTEKQKRQIDIAAKTHDFGKVMYPFQKARYRNLNLPNPFPKDEAKRLDELYNLSQNSKVIPHGYLSPSKLKIKKLKSEFDEIEDIEILINAIVYHHTRDYDFNADEVKKYIDGDIKKRYDANAVYKDYVYKNFIEVEDEVWIKYAIIKGTLNKLDYWASSDRTIPIEIEPKVNRKTLGEIVKSKIISKYKTLRDLQIYMENHREDNVVIVASTGSGKTEAALMWLGESKGFYTLPIRVSINAIYDRIIKEYEYPEEKLSLLHSDAVSHLIELESEFQENSEKDDNNLKLETIIKKYRASKDFSYPITICTVDQLFKFIYKFKGSEILLATLKYSKVIIDEVQAYSPEIIGKLIYGLKLITIAGGKFSIIKILKYILPFIGKDDYKKK